MKLKSILLLAALIFGFTLQAACQDSLYISYSGNLREYPYTWTDAPAQTPPPPGFHPFHMEHYGRHGSRWLIGADDYKSPVKCLETAERNGKLTQLGKKVLSVLRDIEKASHNRLGELSDKGAIQHRVIGRRMAENYPEIFTVGANVDAKATVVIRCILSMFNSLEGLRSVSPEVNIHTDASYADMYFMNYDDKPAWKIFARADTTTLREYKKRNAVGSDYLSRLVTDDRFARDSVAPGLMPYLYWVLANTQSHSGQEWLLPEVFSVDEVRQAWRQDNGMWTLHCINSPLTDNRMPLIQRNLLRNMIECTDSASLSSAPSANLRYGHDGILINLITLLDLNGLGREFDSIEEAEEAGIKSYELIPMAANVQLVFYRNDMGEILVKALLNEQEATLPATPVAGPYYKWQDLRGYYLDKLATL